MSLTISRYALTYYELMGEIQIWQKYIKYFKGRLTLFFANYYLTEYRITMEFLHNFFKPWRNV